MIRKFSPVFSTWMTYESGGELGVGASLAINLDEPLLQDSLDLLSAQSVLQTVPDEQSDGQGGALLVGAGPRLDGEHSSEFVQHPGLGRGEPLQVTLGSTGHFDLLLLL